MTESLLEELKRYVGFEPADEEALRLLHPTAKPHFQRVAAVFYARILSHEQARKALVGGESAVGRLQVTLVAWMDRLLSGPWDEEYYEARCRIGRMHVRIGLDQHYMFGAMNIIRQQLNGIIDDSLIEKPETLRAVRLALGKVLDIELAIMLHTYREDLLTQQARAERLAVFGQLVGSIGHELRNPLGVMETSLFILKQRMGEDERAKKHADRISEQLLIANQIITDLLDLIRDKPLAREPVRIDGLVQEAIGMIRVPPGVRITVTGTTALPEIPGDASQLRQVLVNLLENAVHAVSPQGDVSLSAVDDGVVQIAIQDSGPGIDPAIQARLFEPLMTTKAKGVGLGLALVKRIVERHGGTITSVSKPGDGARFVVRLPKS
jgi:signal transduction histidine kinase